MWMYIDLAWRNIWRHKRRTLLVVAAMGVSLMMMMMYDGTITGFEDSIYGNAIRVLGGNIQVHAEGYREKAGSTPLLPIPDDQKVIDTALGLPNVVAASRRIVTGGMATSREGAFGVSIIGIEPEKELPVNLLAQNVSAGRFLTAEDGDSAFIGQGLASEMDVTVGDRVMVAGRATHEQMRQRTLTIVGIYDVNMPDIEKRTIYISLAEAQALYGLEGQATQVMITLEALGQEPEVLAPLRAALPGYDVQTWDTNFPELKAAIQMKGGVMDVFGVILIAIAGIGILNMLLMAVYERTKEIGLLGAIGLKPWQIGALFILEGFFMGLVGAAVGMLLGLGCMAVFRQVGFDYSQFASLTEYTALITGKIIPSWGLEKITSRVVVVAVISMLAAFYPAWEASHREPAEALHYV